MLTPPSVFADERHVVNAIEAGAGGYLLKDSNSQEIATAIDQLLAGGAPITSSVAVYLLKRYQNPPGTAPKNSADTLLTERERAVLRLIAKGYTYAEVAHSLNVSINTVRTHIKNIFRYQSKAFKTKAKAEQWARNVESEMDRGVFLSTSIAENTLLSELIDRYLTEVAPSKKSEADIKVRGKLLKDKLGDRVLAAITPLTVKEFRDMRLDTAICGETCLAMNTDRSLNSSKQP